MTKLKTSWFTLIFTSILPLFLWMLIVFLLSNRQKVAFTDNYPVSFSIFKTLHLFEYGVLFLLWLRFLFLTKCKYKYWLALIFTFLYGLSDEWHQSYIPGREGKLLDACVDALGGLIAWYLIRKNQALKKIVFKSK